VPRCAVEECRAIGAAAPKALRLHRIVPMRSARCLLAFAVLAPACASSDDTPPVLAVSTPERGTLAESAVVSVAGQVSDDAPGRLSVRVNGLEAVIAPDGSFAVDVPVPPGVDILETIATDGGGNTARDVRAVLAGTLAPANGAVPDALAVHVGPEAFAAIGDGAGAAIDQLDLTAAVQPMNPVFQDPGCLGATVDITGVDVSRVDVGLVPGGGAVAADVTIHDLRVDLHADYQVACIGGSTDLAVLASAVRIRGGLGVDVVDGDLRTALHDVTVQLDGFDLDGGGAPGAVLDLFDGIIDDRVAAALQAVVQEQLPARADAALSELASKTWTVPVLGHDVGFRIAPTDVDLESTGAFVAVDASMQVAGGEAGAYVATPSPVTGVLMQDAPGVGIAVADDAINQLFAGLWASGALDQQLPIEPGNPIALLLDSKTRTLGVTMSLPPTVATDGNGDMRVAIGDLILRTIDGGGEELSRIAISIATTLGAESTADGHLKLRLGEPTVYAQILWQSDQVERPLTGQQIEDVVAAAWSLIGPTADDVLAQVPLPAIAGMTIADPQIDARGGFVVVEASIAPAP